MGALCATGAGCLLGPLAAGMLMGAVVSGSTYVVVTTVLGGTPTWEGVLQSVGWGMVAGGIGAGIGASAIRSVAREVAAPGEDAPEAALEQTPEGRALTEHATMRRNERHISLENIDEAIGHGRQFFDPIRNSRVSVIESGGMRTPVQFGGKYLVVSRNLVFERVTTTYGSSRIPSRFIAWGLWWEGYW